MPHTRAKCSFSTLLLATSLVALGIAGDPTWALAEEAAEKTAKQFVTDLGAKDFANAGTLMAQGQDDVEGFLRTYWEQVTRVTGEFKAIKRVEVKGPTDQRKVKVAMECAKGKFDMIIEFTAEKISKFTVPGLY